jgi:hypothetical protein
VPVRAYFLTFSAYGTHLPGAGNGSVDVKRRAFGTSLEIRDPRRESYWNSRLQETPWSLDQQARQVVLRAMLQVCSHRQWFAHAIHVRTTHVHAVAWGNEKPERMLTDFKAYSTRAIRSVTEIPRSRYWAHHGSTRYLWNDLSLKAAVDYVLNAQGERMACYPDDSGPI